MPLGCRDISSTFPCLKIRVAAIFRRNLRAMTNACFHYGVACRFASTQSYHRYLHYKYTASSSLSLHLNIRILSRSSLTTDISHHIQRLKPLITRDMSSQAPKPSSIGFPNSDAGRDEVSLPLSADLILSECHRTLSKTGEDEIADVQALGGEQASERLRHGVRPTRNSKFWQLLEPCTWFQEIRYRYGTQCRIALKLLPHNRLLFSPVAPCSAKEMDLLGISSFLDLNWCMSSPSKNSQLSQGCGSQEHKRARTRDGKHQATKDTRTDGRTPRTPSASPGTKRSSNDLRTPSDNHPEQTINSKALHEAHKAEVEHWYDEDFSRNRGLSPGRKALKSNHKWYGKTYARMQA